MQENGNDARELLIRSRNEIGLFVSDQVNSMLAYWDKNLVCQFANNAYLEWFGLTGEQMAGITLPQLLGPVYEKNLPYIQGVLRGEKQVFERELVTYNNKVAQTLATYFPDAVNGEVVGFCVHVADITRLKQEELALKASELKFRGILENAPDSIVITDDNGVIELINTRCQEMFGYTSAELVGQPVKILMPHSFREMYAEKLRAFTNKTQSITTDNFVLTVLRKDGEEFPVDVNLSPLRTGGRVIILAAFRDITWKVEKEKELLKSHREIEEKAKQIENILETITDSFIVIDKNWRVKYWNKAAEVMIGKSSEEVLGKSILETFKEYVHTETYHQYRAVLEQHTPSHFEYYYPGNDKWFDISAYPTLGGLTIYCKDISERKEQENELLRTKNNQAALINATKDQIWSVDTEYRLVSANNAYHELVKKHLGREVQEGFNALTATHSGEKNLAWKSLYDRSLKGETFMLLSTSWSDHEVTFTPIYDTQSNTITGVACYSRNVSERIKVEQEKAETEQRFTAMVQHGSDLIAIIDEKYVFEYISPSIYHHFGYSEEFLNGKSPLDFIHPEDFSKISLLIPAFLKQKEIEVPATRVRHASGNWRWVEANVSNLLDDPAVKGVVLNARDVTDRKEREVEKENIIKELTRSNNNLKQFSFITSHNLRAPLSNIVGLLKIFDLTTLDEGSKSLLQMIEKSSEQLSATINDITEIVVIKNNVNTPVDYINIEEVFKKVNRNFINTENDIAAQLDLDFQVSKVYFNQTYLESIFINLISNAIKYRQESCTLKITVRTFINSNRQTVLTFSDNGLGMDLARYYDRLFGMYQRFHSHTDGQGLGLFIVKSQIEALGGEIGVKSELNKGTTFSITFPNSAS
ncbi:MAG: Histidine kinase sensor protein [Segetibacter sp.]|nr:Histidine kinase sensor protein [Segetibacter sp.]